MRTSALCDWLPSSASIWIDLQGAPADGAGNSDEALASARFADVNALESVNGLAFLRFRVEFDPTVDAPMASLASPVPSVAFLRLLFWYRGTRL